MAEVPLPRNSNDLDYYRMRGYPDGDEKDGPTLDEKDVTAAAAEDPLGRLRHLRLRDYRLSTLPVVAAGTSDAAEPGAVRMLVYQEALQAWRQLTEVRFKLLGLLPAVSVLALIQLADVPPDESGLAAWARAWVALVGLVVSVGLRWYDIRNDQLYDDLISRIRRAEMELGVHTGIMLGRLVGTGDQRHGPAVSLIYRAMQLSWAVAFALLTARAAGLVS